MKHKKGVQKLYTLNFTSLKDIVHMRSIIVFLACNVCVYEKNL